MPEREQQSEQSNHFIAYEEKYRTNRHKADKIPDRSFAMMPDVSIGKLPACSQYLHGTGATTQAQCHAVHGDFAEPAAFLGDFAPRSSTLPWRDGTTSASDRQG